MSPPRNTRRPLLMGNGFEQADLSVLNGCDRYLEQSVQNEASIETGTICYQEMVEETGLWYIESEMLHKAIATLSEVQRRRVLLYCFVNMTYLEITELEGCKHPAVMKSSIETLRKYFWSTNSCRLYYFKRCQMDLIIVFIKIPAIEFAGHTTHKARFKNKKRALSVV